MGMYFNPFLNGSGHRQNDTLLRQNLPAPGKRPSLLDPPESSASLLFDGTHLHWRYGGITTSWPAYSGREEFWKNGNFSREAQQRKGEGPLPEGFYMVRQDRLQERPEDILHYIPSLFGAGAWPGGNSFWGKFRVWLEPESNTEIYGRGGFSIHGGTEPGSAGCIDLVERLPEFVKLFQEYGKDARLEVRYPKDNK